MSGILWDDIDDVDHHGAGDARGPEPEWSPLDGLAPQIMLVPDCIGGPVTSFDLVILDD